MTQSLLDRFLSYVTIDTQSNPESQTIPSTEKQWNLAHLLVKELKGIGMHNVTLDANGYIMATLPSNIDKSIPTIGFIAHYDTSPDFSGTNVNPKIIRDYDGGAIVLNKEENIVLSPDYFEDLLLYIGNTLITTDGTTLLGADDKAGIAEIITAMEYLIQNPEIKHGTIKVAFTPDEEIGRGAHKFDVKAFNADWAYTIDGSQVGELEYENFNAAKAKIIIKGKSVHPGYAKNKMVNSMLIANEFIALLPKDEVPEKTSGREGFFHVYQCNGSIEYTEIQLIIRDHDKEAFEARKNLIDKIVSQLNYQYGTVITATVTDQYYNMKEKIIPVFHIVEIAEQAMKDLEITPIIKPIRGGTDGSQLSYMELPCPNIFAGGHNFHGKYEYIPVESMEKAMKTIVRIIQITKEKFY